VLRYIHTIGLSRQPVNSTEHLFECVPGRLNPVSSSVKAEGPEFGVDSFAGCGNGIGSSVRCSHPESDGMLDQLSPVVCFQLLHHVRTVSLNRFD